jgi:hypothetical protein
MATSITTPRDLPETIGHGVTSLLRRAERQPLFVVGIGLVAGYLVARLLDRMQGDR